MTEVESMMFTETFILNIPFLAKKGHNTVFENLIYCKHGKFSCLKTLKEFLQQMRKLQEIRKIMMQTSLMQFC